MSELGLDVCTRGRPFGQGWSRMERWVKGMRIPFTQVADGSGSCIPGCTVNTDWCESTDCLNLRLVKECAWEPYQLESLLLKQVPYAATRVRLGWRSQAKLAIFLHCVQ